LRNKVTEFTIFAASNTLMRILSFNVNGIRSFCRYIKAKHRTTFNDYARDVLKADILCVQETRGDRAALEEFHTLRDYITFTGTNNKRPGSCGVSTFVSKSLYCRGVVSALPYTEDGRVLMTDHGGFKVLNLYFPYCDEDPAADKTDVLEFYERMGALIHGHSDLVVCGDFNATYDTRDHYQFYNELVRIRKAPDGSGEHRAKRHPSKTELPYEFAKEVALEAYFYEVEQRRWMKDLMGSGRVMDTFRIYHSRAQAYTCWNSRLNLRPRNLGTRIDYVLVSQRHASCLRDAGILPEIHGSDHCPVYAELELEVGAGDDNVLKRRKNNLLELFGTRNRK
jgi:exodeoxyribonuclease III